jgi:hypothetical protein
MTRASGIKIGQTEIVVLTGAGASQPLKKPLMNSFMDLLEEELHEEARKVLARIYETYKLPDGEKGRDLEVVLEALTRYEEHIKLYETDLNFIQFVGRAANFNTFKSYVELIRETAIQLIFDHYGSVDADDSVALYSPFIETLLYKQGTQFLPIFTTNYDPAVETYAEQVGIKLVDGFTTGRRLVWKPDLFNEVGPERGQAIALFKLHGSTNWYYQDGEIVVYNGLSSPVVPGCENMILYPAQIKPELIEREPFKTLYFYFEQYLTSAKITIIVGHSLRDKVLVETIRRAVRKNRQLSLIVINKKFSKHEKETLDFIGKRQIGLIEAPFEKGSDAKYLIALRKKLSIL